MALFMRNNSNPQCQCYDDWGFFIKDIFIYKNII